MPLPLLPIIGTVANLGGQAANAAFQAKANRDARNFQLDMYNRQREDYIADYNMQNEYNSPSAQMARLRKAGLNPNLVYGNGQAVTPSAQVKSASVGSYQPKAPQLDIGGAFKEGLSAYIDTKVKEAQVDNLREQNTVLQIESMLKGSQIGVNQATKKKLEQEVSVQGALAPYQIAAKAAEVAKLKAETSYVATQEEIALAMKQPNIEKVLQEILNMKKENVLKDTQISLNQVEKNKKLAEIDEISEKIHNMWLDGKLKEFDLWLKNQRGTAADYNTLGKVITDFFNSVKGAINDTTKGPADYKNLRRFNNVK